MLIHCQQIEEGRTSHGKVGRRRQGSKQRNGNGNSSVNNNNKLWGGPRRRNNNDPIVITDDENPLFPPRSDSFWKSESQSRSGSSNNKRHGKKRQHSEDARVERVQPEIKTPKIPPPPPIEDPAERPNIILIITDDQDVELGSMNYMPETLKEFQDNGIEFRHGYVTTPMCCPSRSSMLTGLYVHNHQVFTNNDNCSSIQWRQKYEKKTFAYQLQSGGYYTSYIGKYLNKYDGSHIPQGWDEWNTLLMNSRFYNYTINRNGRKFRYGNNYQFDYYPDLITNDTLDFLNRAGGLAPDPTSTPPPIDVSEDPSSESGSNSEESTTAAPKQPLTPKKPFLLVVSYPSPHGPEDSAPQYSHLFMNSTPHHTPSYNHAPNLDKQWILRVTDKMTPQLQTFTNLLMTKRLQTLQSVDVSVKQIFNKLRETRLIENTYIFYTSDHGYHVGQFGLIKEIGSLPVPGWVDGRSMLPLIKHYTQQGNNATLNAIQSWGHTFVIESSGRREPISAPTTDSVKKKRKIHRQEEQALEEEETLNNLCLMHPYPCMPQQKKYCKMERSRIRFRKCRAGYDYHISNLSKCSCPSRRKRSSDWDTQRIQIDEEIEELKLKIESLREKRRKLRLQWILNLNQRGNLSLAVTRGDSMEIKKKLDEEIEEELEVPPVFHHSEEEVEEEEEEDFQIERSKNKVRFPEGRRKKPKMRGFSRIGQEEEDERECDCQQNLNPRVLKQIERDERKRRKLMSKIRKKQRFLNRIDDPRVRLQAETCGTEEKMNCFWHDADHWRTPPLWRDGSFCFCMNSNNNTFTCLRSINATHNYLYCHFITGFKMYFNLREDPHELRNLIGSLPAPSEDWMLNQLFHLKKCQGTLDCWPDSVESAPSPMIYEETTEANIWPQILGRRGWKGKRKSRNGRRKQY
ncbi:unnamed protein product [Allacma fusca]|uniref:Sulfatase N-terminal domain-containing protein n=1 Tax=Allacma fusca TaxID=39272 RepID=A0A8J2LUK7_9HEXA|nr:unnamed protein product [Allacma fusca]